MPRDKAPTREDLIRQEREIGKNVPKEMVGMDDGDVRPEGEAPAGGATGGREDAGSAEDDGEGDGPRDPSSRH